MPISVCRQIFVAYTVVLICTVWTVKLKHHTSTSKIIVQTAFMNCCTTSSRAFSQRNVPKSFITVTSVTSASDATISTSFGCSKCCSFQVASFGSLFVAPPVGLALGATSAAAGVSSTTGDAVADAELWQPRFKPFKLEDFVTIFLRFSYDFLTIKQGEHADEV